MKFSERLIAGSHIIDEYDTMVVAHVRKYLDIQFGGSDENSNIDLTGDITHTSDVQRYTCKEGGFFTIINDYEQSQRKTKVDPNY